MSLPHWRRETSYQLDNGSRRLYGSLDRFLPAGAAMVPLYSLWMVYTSLPIGAAI